jgi:FkbM family methyltransferase
MVSQFVKAVALKAIALGMKLPEPQIDRVIELLHLRRLLSFLRINCVLDVGANHGQFAKELRAIGYSGRIVSFEPLQREFDRMSEHFSHDANWRGYRLALGSDEALMDIHVDRLTVLSSFLNSIAKHDQQRTERVSVKRLDTMFSSVVQGIESPRVFLKMDTQGYDLEVFNGAAGCIAEICGIQSELSVQPLYEGMPHYLEALETYERAGFDLHNLSVVNRESDGGLVELNCFMRRKA